MSKWNHNSFFKPKLKPKIFYWIASQDDLPDELPRAGVDHWVDGPGERRPRLVVEDDDHRRPRQRLRIGNASAQRIPDVT